MTPERYEFRVQGDLPSDWSNWFEGLELRVGAEGETILSGTLADQSALHGVLAKIQNLNLRLISVTRGGRAAQNSGTQRKGKKQ
jgi:hypothetical protein